MSKIFVVRLQYTMRAFTAQVQDTTEYLSRNFENCILLQEHLSTMSSLSSIQCLIFCLLSPQDAELAVPTTRATEQCSHGSYQQVYAER